LNSSLIGALKDVMSGDFEFYVSEVIGDQAYEELFNGETEQQESVSEELTNLRNQYKY
jgi:hypothetical protein